MPPLHEVLAEAPPVRSFPSYRRQRSRLGNLRWQAGYRHRRCLNNELTAPLLEAFVEPQALVAGARAVGDPIAVLPSVFHLLWSGQLHVDLATRLDMTPLVTAAAR